MPPWRGEYAPCDPAALAIRLSESASAGADSVWLNRWISTDAAAKNAAGPSIERTGPQGASEPGVLAAAARAAASDDAVLFVSNSMPVRDLDAFAPRDLARLRVEANRGASGIDGIVSTAAGVSLGAGVRVVCVLGDLAFYHDMNGLLATREDGVAVTYVVIHNDGGGIFHMLPIREFDPQFTRHFATPHGLDFSHAASLYGLPFQDATGASDLTRVIQDANSAPGSAIVQVRTDREENRTLRASAVDAAVDAALRTLDADGRDLDADRRDLDADGRDLDADHSDTTE